ncbi:kinase-like domain-containing protein [Jimgerdemannia flammicorona]|uniref:Kinase-like domain-containing protein n=1 Tax=Jimgerdemannia flammicorona TaxID=994334 RepID=A0A433Q888_9FUNG|nr:kinase-like domain-containing protein [Jimgerdemannia flammicorona]
MSWDDDELRHPEEEPAVDVNVKFSPERSLYIIRAIAPGERANLRGFTGQTKDVYMDFNASLFESIPDFNCSDSLAESVSETTSEDQQTPHPPPDIPYPRLYFSRNRTLLENARDDPNSLLVILTNVQVDKSQEPERIAITADSALAKPLGARHNIESPWRGGDMSMETPKAWMKLRVMRNVGRIETEITKEMEKEIMRKAYTTARVGLDNVTGAEATLEGADESVTEREIVEGFMRAVLGPPEEENDQTKIVLRKLKEECNLHQVPLRRITSYTENLTTFPAAEGFFKQVYHVQNDDSVVVQTFREMTLLQRVTEVVCLLKLRGIPNIGQITEMLEDETGDMIGLSMVRYQQTLKQYTHSHSHHRITAHQKYHLIHEMLRALQGIHECGLAHRDLSEVNMMVNESDELLEDGSRMPLLYMIDFGKATFCASEDVRKWWVQPEEDAEDGPNPNPKTEKELEDACAKLPWVKGTPDHGYKMSIQTLPKSRVDTTPLPHMIHPQAEDVYSLGVIIWKTFTETEPWQGILDTDLKSLRHQIQDDYRIQRILDKEIKGDFSRQLVSMCLKVNPLDRRTADEILKWIETPHIMGALIREWTPEKDKPERRGPPARSTGGAGGDRGPVEKRGRGRPKRAAPTQGGLQNGLA